MEGVWIDWKEYQKKVCLSIWYMDVWSITGKKTNVYYVMGSDFSATPDYVIWKYPLEWVYFILFKVYYQSLNLYIHLWNVSLDGLIRWCPLITECHLLFTTASHTLHITSDSPWGFFWETWVQRSKKEVYFVCFLTCFYPSFISTGCWNRNTETHWQKLQNGSIFLSNKSRISGALKIP